MHFLADFNICSYISDNRMCIDFAGSPPPEFTKLKRSTYSPNGLQLVTHFIICFFFFKVIWNLRKSTSKHFFSFKETHIFTSLKEIYFVKIYLGWVEYLACIYGFLSWLWNLFYSKFNSEHMGGSNNFFLDFVQIYHLVFLGLRNKIR